MSKVIKIDYITSIGENYFSLLHKRKIIDNYPFELKKKVTPKTLSNYHFDRNDLEKMSTVFDQLAPYQAGDGISKKEFIYSMKMSFYHRIKNGDLSNILSAVNPTYGEFEYEWVGKEPPEFKV